MKAKEENITGKLTFIHFLLQDLNSNKKHNRRSVEKLAASYGISDKTQIKEYTEFAIVLTARKIALSNTGINDRYNQIVRLYHKQVNLSHRTSQSILLQQYSTPAPIAFLAGIFANINESSVSVFEPSAGNGLLTIAAPPSRVVVNEIDTLRRSNLTDQGYKQVLKQDATQPFTGFEKKFDAVLTNPPFGTLDKAVTYDTFPIRVLDHLMALRALDTMKDDGKAAIIIGGHTRYDRKGRIQAGKDRLFFNYLYSRYHVVDAINIDGHKLYSRQGTSFDVRLILINGRKRSASGAAPVYDTQREEVVDSFDELYARVMSHVHLKKEITPSMKNSIATMSELEAEALKLEAMIKGLSVPDDLGMPYTPASQSCVVLNTVVPDSMGYEMHQALARVREAVHGDVDEYVRLKLNYRSKTELCKALSAEQIDAVAMTIYNIEERGVGMIIGDQTGIGKGRIAASMIRYGVAQGFKPVFITEKANLFSDIYRDLVAIGSSHLVPFIVNGRESKTDIKNEDGEVVYQALSSEQQNAIFEARQVPPDFQFVVATYSQFNSPEKKPLKPSFLKAIADGSIVIMDEAHNSSGSGNTGQVMQGALAATKGVVFLSATFAKRPDNMPVYALKTSIRDASMSQDDLISAINDGGVALQEILASQLVAEGQMIRRERSYEGVEVNYVTLSEKEQEHKAVADNITSIIRDIIHFQTIYVDKEVEALDNVAAAEGKQVEMRGGTSKAGVDNLPYFSKVFQVINQMLFSIKSEAVAELAIARLKEGKKPVIAFSSTMGSFVERAENEKGLPVSDGDVINADFSAVLQKGLDGILRYTATGIDGSKEFKSFSLSNFSQEARDAYQRIQEKIAQASTGISISPIDVIIEKIEEAGYTVAEVTGRKFKVQFNSSGGNADLGEPGGNPDFKRGDRVMQLSTGRTGRVEFILKQGFIIPGRDNTKNYSYEYHVRMDGSNSTLSIDEKDLKLYTGSSVRNFTGMVLSRKRENVNDAFRRFNNNEADVLLINQSGSTGASAHAIITSKVPREQVKQRVMIVLQAELDINTEVQKRGRINRTGQIYLPIYDYVNSAIPAEMRLMMMLQKKLKSLDANTTSNQKSSTKILDVPDFLNKYGDKVVREYLAEKPEINKLLDDPLNILTEGEENDDGNERRDEGMSDDAAHRVSGRVAVLSTEMQQDFYNEISTRYNEYVEYLKQIGEYDLEVEAMDLKAETIDVRPLIIGKGGNSEFGSDSNLETVIANVLRKPFKPAELNSLLNEALQGRNAKELQREIIDDFERFMQEDLQRDLRRTEARFNDRLLDLPELLATVYEGKSEEFYQERLEASTKNIEEDRKNEVSRLERYNKNLTESLGSFFKAFYIGRNLYYRVNTWDAGEQMIPATFLGFIIDKKKKNPYRPSAIRLRFAIASSHKYLVLPASRYDDVRSIIGASATLPELNRDALLGQWESAIRDFTVDRRRRYIITGNLLQAFATHRGKLVSYTTLDGTVKKGILLPDFWEPPKGTKEKTVVPVERALKIIRSLVPGQMITSRNNVSLLKQRDGYQIMVPSARTSGGDVYLDPDILRLVHHHNFEKVSSQMRATLDADNIDELVKILQRKFSDSVVLSASQYELIRNDIQRGVERKPLPKVVLPESLPQDDNELVNQLELEAMALELELELLNFAA